MVPYISVTYFSTSYFWCPIFEVPVLKSVVPNVGISYVWCVLLLCSYRCWFLSLCYSINGVAPVIWSILHCYYCCLPSPTPSILPSQETALVQLSQAELDCYQGDLGKTSEKKRKKFFRPLLERGGEALPEYFGPYITMYFFFLEQGVVNLLKWYYQHGDHRPHS